MEVTMTDDNSLPGTALADQPMRQMTAPYVVN
jgi:hypothetical protein